MSEQTKQSSNAIPPVGPRRGGPDARITAAEKPKNLKQTFKKLWRYLSNYKGKMVLVFFIVAFTTFSNLISTRLVGVAIDDYISKGDFEGLAKIIILLLVIYVLSSVFTYLQTQLSVNLSQSCVFKIREDVFNKLQQLPLNFFDTRSRGDIMSRVTNDIDNISNALNTSLAQIFSSVLTIIGIVIFMLLTSPVLTLVVFVTLPLLFLLTRAITKRSRVLFKDQQRVLGQLNGKIEEDISGQRVIKVFSKEDDETEAFEKLNQELKIIGARAQILSGTMGPCSTFINSLTYGLITVVGASLCLQGKIRIGEITSFLIYSRQFSRPFNEMANQYNLLISAVAGAERVFEILEQDIETPDKEGAVELNDVKGDVVFNNVDFSYVEGVPILSDICLEAKAGQTIALVGPTGAGKTTIINLLTRFYDIQDGTITIDGKDIFDIKRRSLRECLGIVLQDTYLFSGSIMENIRYGRPDATDNEVKQAAMLAMAHDFIQRLTNGYDTELSEDSDLLSQGQKQMLAIARAILANPSILILDEATSNVDTRTEVKIQQAMLNLMKNRTSFVIAHRLSTIKNADLIAVINQGRIIEKGTHQELLDKKGFYYNLYMTQFSS